MIPSHEQVLVNYLVLISTLIKRNTINREGFGGRWPEVLSQMSLLFDQQTR